MIRLQSEIGKEIGNPKGIGLENTFLQVKEENVSKI